MITEKVGDLLTSDADILAHQTNCVGVMGAGVARQFRDKLLSTDAYAQYVSLCKEKGAENLGTLQLLPLKNEKTLANLFGENIPTGHEVDTDYEALKSALSSLKRIAEENHMSIALPGYMGCGLAGGDWDTVYEMIEELFADSAVRVEIVYHPSNVIEETCTLTGEEEMFEFTYPIFCPSKAWERRSEAIRYIAETRGLCGAFEFTFRGKRNSVPYRLKWGGKFHNGKLICDGRK